MKCPHFFVSLILVIFTCSFAQPIYQLSWDHNFSPRAGAENIQLAHKVFFKLEERVLKNRLWEERGIFRKTGGIIYRLGRTIFITDVVSYYATVLQHEYFGHGYRARQYNMDEIDYEINPPFPYGKGGGQTSYQYKENPGINEELSLAYGGVGATDVMSYLLKMKWVAGRKIPYYQAGQYMSSSLDLLLYIHNKELQQADLSNDIYRYTTILNFYHKRKSELLHPYFVPDTLSQDHLKINSLVTLLDPFLAFAIWSYFKTFIWSGKTDLSLPMIPLGKVYYLPAFRYALTPFGAEQSLEHYFHLYNRTLALFMRLGDNLFFSFWSCGIETGGMLHLPHGTLDLRAEFWSQPEMFLGTYLLDGDSKKAGGAFWLKSHVPLDRVFRTFGITLEAGYKMKGYIQGEPLASGLSFRIGAVLIN